MPHPIDPIVVEAFSTSVKTTFEQLTDTNFEVMEVSTSEDRAAEHRSAYLELQRSISGVVVIEMPPTLLATLAGRYVPTAGELTADMQDDALREWLNVIAGQAKTLLKGTPYHYMLSLPRSGQYSFSREVGKSVFSIRFAASDGTLVLRILLPACE